MKFYICFLLLLLIPLLAQYTKNYVINYESRTEISLLLASGMIFFVMACRSMYVGADTKQYLRAFLQLNSVSLHEALSVRIYSWSGKYTYSLEIGYRLYNKLLGFFNKSGQIITIANSLFIAVLLYKLIRRNSTFYLLSIWLYITLGFFQTQMNMTRNAIAILICLNATKYIEEHKFFRYVLSSLFAASFHLTALIYIPLYWLANYVRLTKRRITIALILSIFAVLLLPIVNPILKIILPSRYLKYLTNVSNRNEGIYLAVLFLGLFLIISIFSDRKEKAYDISEYDNTGAWLFILMIISFSFSYSINAMTRVAALFSPYLIIFFPRMIYFEIADQKKRIFLYFVIFALCFAQYVFRLSINNIGGTVPYEFFWEV